MLHTSAKENLSRKGAYVIKGSAQDRDVTILSTGSEVSIAVEAMEKLQQEGIKAAVVSMPCWELFEQQPLSYRKEVLGSKPRIAIEAASAFGWDRYVGENGRIIAMEGFGASGPADKLYEHFGITANAIVQNVKEMLKK